MDYAEFVKNRRNRAIATILSYKESNVDPLLSSNDREALRRVILNGINDFADLVLDIVKAQSAPVLVNDLYLDALTRIEHRLDEII